MSTLEGALVLAVLLVLLAFVYRLFRSASAPDFVKSEVFGDAVALFFTAGFATGIVMISINAKSDGVIWDLAAGSVLLAALVAMIMVIVRTKSGATMPAFAPFAPGTPVDGGVNAPAANSNRRKARKPRAA